MNHAKALLGLSALMIGVDLLQSVETSAQMFQRASRQQPATTTAPSLMEAWISLPVSATFKPVASQPAASKPATTQSAYPLWDGNESVADYAKRAGIKDVQITLALDSNVTMKLTLIPAGKFLMGSPESEKGRNHDEGPQHEVTISKPFYMGVYTVTQEQYQEVMGTNPSFFQGKCNPVDSVSWDEAMEFCENVSQKTGKPVDLPLEAQWEYACRAGTKGRFSFGDDANTLGDYAWYSRNSEVKTHAVGEKKPNEWGLYDMYGNVSQWCDDWYTFFYADGNKAYPQGINPRHVVRGSGFYDDPSRCRSATRRGFPGVREARIGFRIILDLSAACPVESPGTPATVTAVPVKVGA